MNQPMTVRCKAPGCGWQSIAASRAGALSQYADHIFEEHANEVEVEIDIPDGMVEIKTGVDDEWRLVTIEEAMRIHEEVHER